MLKTLSKTFLSLVFPVSCELCSALLPAGGTPGVCSACRGHLQLIPPPWCAGCGRNTLDDKERCGHCRQENFHFDRAYACVYYDDRMKELLHAFKFGHRRYLLPFFETLLTDFMQKNLSADDWDVVVPVPMDGAHERERGFNQAKLFSAIIAKTSGKTHAAGALACRKSSAAQSSLTRLERKRNAAGRFLVGNTDGIASGRVLLVDDILTTGQTASACAKALKDAGARTVTIFALARGL